MGAEPYFWITRYRDNIAEALENARREVFAAGRFNLAEEHPASIEEAQELCAEEGTGSLLDIMEISEQPELLCASGLSPEELIRFFGTERPSPEEIESCFPFWDSVGRGEARYIFLYEGDTAVEILFAGYTVDAMSAGNGSYRDVPAAESRPKKKKALPPAVLPEEVEEEIARVEAYFTALRTRSILPDADEAQKITAIIQKYRNNPEVMMRFMRILSP